MRSLNTKSLNMLRLLAILVVAVLLASSCQRVINLDLKTTNSKVVIEGFVTDQTGFDSVKISRSGSYFSPGTYPYVNNALVIVSDNLGLNDTLQLVDSGRYSSSTFTGVPGRAYTLKVLVDGKEYDAVSTMPAPVNIDSLYISETGSGSDTGYRVRGFFMDPVGLGNFYRAQLFVGDSLIDGSGTISIAEDKFADGTEMGLRARGYTVHFGDTIQYYLMTIDANVYNYLSVARSIAGSGNPISTATPQNPPTNILGGALGYFSAQAARSKTIIVP